MTSKTCRQWTPIRGSTIYLLVERPHKSAQRSQRPFSLKTNIRPTRRPLLTATEKPVIFLKKTKHRLVCSPLFDDEKSFEQEKSFETFGVLTRGT